MAGGERSRYIDRSASYPRYTEGDDSLKGDTMEEMVDEKRAREALRSPPPGGRGVRSDGADRA